MMTLYVLLLPLILFAGALVVIILDAFVLSPSEKTYRITLLTLIASGLSTLFLWHQRGSAFQGMLVLDTFSLTTSVLFCFAAFVAVLLAHGTKQSTPQFHALVLITVIGMILLTSGSHFIVLFIGLEVLSLSIYVLAAFAKGDPLSAESGIKYFLLGSFASAFFLYGVAFIYGSAGTMHLLGLGEITNNAAFPNQVLLYLGITFLLVGYSFKISLAPFHMWTPDVYEGAPTAVTAFMAATVKAAALASLIRVFLVAFPSASAYWSPLIWVLAALTMFAGNLAALQQSNLKRLLAYSSIAHAGYMLTGLLAEPAQAQQSILYYFAVYVFMNLGAFTLVHYLERSSEILKVEEYQSLAYRRPVLAVCMTLFLVSLGGLPPTAGFFGKFYLFRAVLQSGHVFIVVIAVLNSAISFYYYLRVVLSMFTPEKQVVAGTALSSLSLPLVVTLALTVWGTLTLGIFPNFFLELARTISLQ